MLKKIACTVMGLGLAFQAQAFDKTQVNLSQDFWGVWSIYNANTKCTETYKFTQPGTFIYTIKQKKMTGDFAIIRNSDPKILDLLIMNVKSDNKKPGCNGQVKDYSNGKVNLTLKWMSAKTAEICTNREGTQCTGLYLIKQK